MDIVVRQRAAPGTSGSIAAQRSAQADALALPGFTFGLDILLVVGQWRLEEHQTVDEIHQSLQERLAEIGQTISRREILFLFEAYSALLRAGTEVHQDASWKQAAQEHGGLVDAQGHHLYTGGEAYGSELAWAKWIVTPQGVVPSDQQLAENYLKYMAFQVGQVGPSLQDWQFTIAGFNALRPMGDIYNSTNADLSAFRAHGGKLII